MRRAVSRLRASREMRGARLAWVILAIVGLLAGLAQAPSAATPGGDPTVHFHPGSADLNDPLVPGLGNGGYGVSHYDIDLHYTKATGLLSGRTTISARLTQNLSSFNLDFVLPVRSVTVNGQAADFELKLGDGFYYGKELVVTPAAGLPKGSRMTVVVSYAGKPMEVKVHGYSEAIPTLTGITIWNEPDAASEWWFPGNAYPRDKATYDVTVTTGKAYRAITNGTLVSRTIDGDQATSHWRSTAPMSSYLAFLSIGKYDVVRGTVPGGTPSYFAYERTRNVYMQRARHDVSRTPEIIGVLQKWWGPYPFDVTGAIVNQTEYGSAFESQTRPTFMSVYWRNHPSNVWAVVHELAHQWYGDNVSMTRWRHIWLAEGFATYTESLWSQAHGSGTAEQLFLANYRTYPKDDDFWKEPVIHPSFALGNQAYERGGMTLQALRNVVGATSFFTIMREWGRVHRHGNADSLDFADLASKISGQDLTAFFRVWLEAAHRPAPIPRNGFPKGFAAELAAGRVTVPPSYDDIARTDAALAGR